MHTTHILTAAYGGSVEVNLCDDRRNEAGVTWTEACQLRHAKQLGRVVDCLECCKVFRELMDTRSKAAAEVHNDTIKR